MTLLPSYPSKKGYYTTMELKILAIVLGYDGDMFQRCLKRQGLDISQGNKCSETELKVWLDDHVFDHELDHVFNQYTVSYNVKVIRKVILLLHHRSLSFNEIASSRRAFKTITAREKRVSLSTDRRPILFALKMVGKVLPPTKLQHMIQAMKHRLDHPCSLNLCDFLDIVARAEEIQHLTVNSKTDVLQIESLFETPYHQLLTSLDVQYKASLLKLKAKRVNTCKIPLVSTPAEQQEESLQSLQPNLQMRLHMEAVERAVRQARESITPGIHKTTILINLARAGNGSLSSSEGNRMFSRLSSRHSERVII